MEQDEQTFLAEYNPRAYDPIAVSVDTVALTLRDGALHILAIERERPPFKGFLALPGTFLKPEAPIEPTALDGVHTKTSVVLSHVEQLGTYAAVDRDPRMRVVSVAYLAFGPSADVPKAGYHATDAVWLPLFQRPVQWAFDHQQMVVDGLRRAQDKLEYTSLATKFLPEQFTMDELRGVYEAVWNQKLRHSNFHRKVMTTPGFVEPVEGASRKSGRSGPRPRLYRAGPATMLYPPIRREGGNWP